MRSLTKMLKRASMGLLAAAWLLQTAAADEVSVAVAANFTDAMRDIAAEFETATGHKAVVSYASTGKLYAQIENGAPFEVFLAADALRPEKAIAEGHAVPGTQFTYAKGRLALWSPEAGLFSDGAAYLKANDFAHIAIANPRTAPYGVAAEQVLAKLGVLETVAPKLVRGDTITQAFQFVASTNAQAGFVALSQVRSLSGATGSTWEVPKGDYDAIVQDAVLLKKGEDNPAAQAFLEFLKGETATNIALGYGYGVE